MSAASRVVRYEQRNRELAPVLAPIDPDHEDVAAFVNDIAIAVEAGGTPGQVLSAVDELLERIAGDLDFEERVMRAAHYPHRAEHEQAHRRFAHDLSGVAAACISADEPAVAPVLICVRRWLAQHGPDLDRKLAAFLLSAQR